MIAASTRLLKTEDCTALHNDSPPRNSRIVHGAQDNKQRSLAKWKSYGMEPRRLAEAAAIGWSPPTPRGKPTVDDTLLLQRADEAMEVWQQLAMVSRPTGLKSETNHARSGDIKRPRHDTWEKCQHRDGAQSTMYSTCAL
jgi:hypothetical protein